jgi:hypothetical protein
MGIVVDIKQLVDEVHLVVSCRLLFVGGAPNNRSLSGRSFFPNTTSAGVMHMVLWVEAL